MKARTREQWMLAGVEALRPRFEAAGHPIPEKVRVSTGWPGGKGTKRSTIGQCWATATVADGTAAIFISPVLSDPVAILATLTHELCHAADDCKSGHRKGFIEIAKSVGLVKPWTATTPDEGLKADLAAIAKRLGTFDHGAIAQSGRSTQTTRMLKVVCPDCGCVVRMTRKWLDTAGAPKCGCGTYMEEDLAGLLRRFVGR